MTRGSKLLDRGKESMLVYPVVYELDRLGNRHRVPDHTQPIQLYVNVSTDRQASAELPGQVDVKVLKVSFRGFPEGVTLQPNSYDRIELRGEEWDVAVPPLFSNNTRATRHWAVILRSRNKAGA